MRPPPATSFPLHPGCLFAVTLLISFASVPVWIGWRAHRQQERLEFFEQLGATLETEPASPAWLHDLVLDTIGEERAAGFTDITVVSLDATRVTDADLQYLSDLTRLRDLRLHNTHVSGRGQHLHSCPG